MSMMGGLSLVYENCKLLTSIACCALIHCVVLFRHRVALGVSAIVFIDGIHAKPDLYLRLMFTLAKATRLFTQLKTRENTLPR